MLIVETDLVTLELRCYKRFMGTGLLIMDSQWWTLLT